MDENTIWITNEDGEEFEARILFTFESEETGKKYVFLQGPGEEDSDSCAAYEYTDDGDLNEISDEEMEMCEEVLNAFLDEEIL